MPHDLGAAPEHHVLAAGGLACLSERGLDSVGDEVEGGPSLHLHGGRALGEGGGFSSLWFGPATKPSSEIEI
jgi:hypothetical protein